MFDRLKSLHLARLVENQVALFLTVEETVIIVADHRLFDAKASSVVFEL